MSRIAVGIDLGTSRATIAIYRNDKIEVIPNEYGGYITPSIVAFTRRDILVGEPAKNQQKSNLENTIYDNKRIIGKNISELNFDQLKSDYPFHVESRNGKVVYKISFKKNKKTKYISPEEISSIVLKYLKRSAEKYLGQEIKYAVITVPAYFNDNQRQATKKAGQLAGLNILRIINEPTAAAIAFGLNTREEQKTIIVYDAGSGTVDASLLTIDNSIIEIKATNGDASLGGLDLDQALARHFQREFRKINKIDCSKSKRSWCKLLHASEKAKHILSQAKETTVEIDGLHQGTDFHTTLTRAKFEQLCRSLFMRMIVPLDNMIKDVKDISKEQISEIVLVGGTTRIPKIQEKLTEFFNGKPLNYTINPDEAVAHGAAIQAALLSSNYDQNSPAADILLIDIIPMTLGLETADDKLYELIAKNTTIPVSVEKDFTTHEDKQSAVSIKIYEGEEKLAKDNHLLGQFDLEGIPPMAKGDACIKVRFAINSDGILEVSAYEVSTGVSKRLLIDKKIKE